MGLRISLEDERGDELEHIGDVHRHLLKLIAQRDTSTTCCLRFVNPYGDTTFNQLQMPQLLAELASLREYAAIPEEQELLAGIVALSDKCLREPHIYIKIRGD